MIFRNLIVFTLLFLSTQICTAKSDSVSLKSAVARMNDFLLKKDTTQLKALIANTISYGHSNGWVQDSRSLLIDLFNGKLTYTVINQEIASIVFESNTATVRANAAVEGVVDGTPFAMKLHILQVWIDTGAYGWKLVARQSAKIL